MKSKILITGIVLVLLTGCSLFDKPSTDDGKTCKDIRKELKEVKRELDTIRWAAGKLVETYEAMIEQVEIRAETTTEIAFLTYLVQNNIAIDVDMKQVYRIREELEKKNK